MKTKKENGLAGIDMVIAIIAIMIFSTLIISMIHNNTIENVKLKKETLAMIYITEIFENIGIQSYDNLPIGTYSDIGANEYDEKIESLIPDNAISNYKIDMKIEENLDGLVKNENILKKIELTLTYKVVNKSYTCYMERMKIKE